MAGSGKSTKKMHRLTGRGRIGPLLWGLPLLYLIGVLWFRNVRVRLSCEACQIRYMRTSLEVLAVVAMCQLTTAFSQAQDIDSVAPVVVKAVPEAGSKDVSPGVVEIRVTFSKEMKDQSWSWSSAWEDSVPEAVGKPRYEADHKTCVLKVKLDPNRTYGYWINSNNFHGFQDRQGRSAVPYLLVFRTKGQ